MTRKAHVLHPAQLAGATHIRVNALEMARIYDAARALGRAIRVEAVKKDGTPRTFISCNRTKEAAEAITGKGAPSLKPTQRRVWDATANGWRIVDMASTYSMKCGATFVLDASA